MSERTLAIIILIALVVFIALCAVSVCVVVMNPAPMTGHISRMSHHPAYFPADSSTPWVYAIGITSTDGRRATTWNVSREVYERYSVGDLVKRGDH